MSAYSSETVRANYDSPKKIGTKGELRSWLTSMKNMTYTKYTTLAVDVKAGIMEEYKKKLQKSRSTVIVEAPAQENTHV